jgi:hypothetical protein
MNYLCHIIEVGNQHRDGRVTHGAYFMGKWKQTTVVRLKVWCLKGVLGPETAHQRSAFESFLVFKPPRPTLLYSFLSLFVEWHSLLHALSPFFELGCMPWNFSFVVRRLAFGYGNTIKPEAQLYTSRPIIKIAIRYTKRISPLRKCQFFKRVIHNYI